MSYSQPTIERKSGCFKHAHGTGAEMHPRLADEMRLATIRVFIDNFLCRWFVCLAWRFQPELFANLQKSIHAKTLYSVTTEGIKV